MLIVMLIAYAYVGTATAAVGYDNNAYAIAIAFDADIADVDLATDDGDDGGDVHEDKWGGGWTIPFSTTRPC